MCIEFQFYATLRDAVGERTVAVDGAPAFETRERTTVSDGNTFVLPPGLSGGGPPNR
jgi:hypothetical protein